MNERPEEKQSVRVHRVGTLTLGLELIVFGILFLLHIFLPQLSYERILRLWPCVLISLGVEVLAFGAGGKRRFRYDAAAVILMALLLFFAMGMGFWSEFLIKQVAREIIVW